MMDILEANLWTHIYKVRNDFKDKVKNDEDMKKLKNEVDIINQRYKGTSAAIPSMWLCRMLLETFNQECN